MAFSAEEKQRRDKLMSTIKMENGQFREASPVLGHRDNGEPWESVERGSSFPQPAPALPHHHTPTKPKDPNVRYPNPNSTAGYPSFTALLYEDPEIRVFENRIIPGLLGPKHTHDDDYWLCCAHRAPSNLKMTGQQDNTGDPSKSWKLGSFAAVESSVAFVKNGHTETADNPPENPICIFYAIEIVGAPLKDATPAGWGASSGVLYENTEVKISDLRVPPGQAGQTPLLPEGVSQIFHVDVSGQRKGAPPMSEVRAGKGLGFGKGKYGNTYNFRPGERTAEAANAGAEPYRGVVIEVKAMEPAITARL